MLTGLKYSAKRGLVSGIEVLMGRDKQGRIQNEYVSISQNGVARATKLAVDKRLAVIALLYPNARLPAASAWVRYLVWAGPEFDYVIPKGFPVPKGVKAGLSKDGLAYWCSVRIGRAQQERVFKLIGTPAYTHVAAVA